MPPLNEGDLMFMPVTDPAIGLPQAIEIIKKQNAAIASVPEVAGVVAKIARAETSTDPAPINMVEAVVNLKPEREWRPGMTRERIIAEADQAAACPVSPTSGRSHHQQNQHADHGHSIRGRREGLRRRSRRLAGASAGRLPTCCGPFRAQRTCTRSRSPGRPTSTSR
jgi:hypothetical protein